MLYLLLKERFPDLRKALSQIILISNKASELNEALGLEKQIDSFSFVLVFNVSIRYWRRSILLPQPYKLNP